MSDTFNLNTELGPQFELKVESNEEFTLTVGTKSSSLFAGGGEAGPQGPVGPQGEQGLIGPQGIPGEDSVIPGPIGPQGPKGDTGDTGLQGADSTVAGPPGNDGALGPKGDTGSTGADSTVPGPVGPTGPQGIKGDTGDAGADGINGSDGDDSVVPGPKGDKGDQGDVGTTGPAGTDGADSTVPGPKGDQGLPGSDGADGVSSIVPLSSTSTSYSLSNIDLAGNVFHTLNNASAITVTVPSGLTGVEPATFIQIDVGAVTFVASSGVTLLSANSNLKMRTRYSSVTIIPDPDTLETYYLVGDLDT